MQLLWPAGWLLITSNLMHCGGKCLLILSHRIELVGVIFAVVFFCVRVFRCVCVLVLCEFCCFSALLNNWTLKE